MITFNTPNSSNIKSVAYDEDKSILSVTFTNGGSYDYADVPRELVESFRKAPSYGKFFFANVKNRYKSTKK